MKEVDFDIVIPEKEPMISLSEEEAAAKSAERLAAASEESEGASEDELEDELEDESESEQGSALKGESKDKSREDKGHQAKSGTPSMTWRQWLVAEDVDMETVLASIRSISFTTLFRNNWKIIFVAVLYSVIYVYMGYYHRNLLIDNDKYNRDLLDRRYKALTRSSELRERTLGSKIEDQLQDTTLQASTEAPFELPVSESEKK